MARMYWMDTARGAAVVAVVVMHAELGAVGATGEQLPLVHAFNDLLGDVRMPILVFLSGVLLPRSLAKGYRSHLDGKLRHILWPYAVWASLDVTHVFIDSAVQGQPLPWELAAQLLHDPQTYLWFLPYLFCFHVLAGLLPGPGRALAVPVVFWLSTLTPVYSSADKFAWLFAWFLVGDVTARALAGRVPPSVAGAANRLHVPPLAAVGRCSLVYYACHMLVVIYVVDLLVWSGIGDATTLWVGAVAAALASGWLLARVQKRRGWRLLVSWPKPRLEGCQHSPSESSPCRVTSVNTAPCSSPVASVPSASAVPASSRDSTAW